MTLKKKLKKTLPYLAATRIPLKLINELGKF
jgi:hypothetical protein